MDPLLLTRVHALGFGSVFEVVTIKIHGATIIDSMVPPSYSMTPPSKCIVHQNNIWPHYQNLICPYHKMHGPTI